MYDKLFETQPDLARSPCPSSRGGPGRIQPSLQTPFYMASILESPKKGLDETYATIS